MSGASIAVSVLRTVDSILSIDVTVEMFFTVGGGQGRERPRRAPCVANAETERLQGHSLDSEVSIVQRRFIVFQ
jgi:hypothetical protein